MMERKLNNYVSTTEDPAITLFPEPEDVLEDPSLTCYFLPMLSFTHEHLEDQRAYRIHLLSTDGLQCLDDALYSEQHIWGFEYHDGKYRFLGDIDVFGGVNIPEVYAWLVEDFDRNCEYYLHEKRSAVDYGEQVQVALSSIANFEARSYAENVYSYLYARTHYQRTGEFRHIDELIGNHRPMDQHLLLDRLEAQEMSAIILDHLPDTLRMRYDMQPEMIVGGAERFRFLSASSGGAVLALLNTHRQQVYLLE
ncbi:hypothetical protein [Paenibacillus sp. WLX2291]|uniref:hypothetical protein n=1 Tax=Paenibacillus sp. WLX2291 TaxID=3296934 RepID=UPI00398429BC